MVGFMQNEGEQWSAGIAYIALPSDIERALYIDDCYKNHRVSVKMEDGSLINRVPISIDVLNFISFPLTPKELGTAVGFITEPKHQQPMVIAQFQKSDELGQGRENSFQISRQLNDKIVAIIGDADKGTLSINIDGANKRGELHVSLDNNNADCVFDLEVSGNINIKTTEATTFENHVQFKSTISDTEEQESQPSIISQTRERTLLANKEMIFNGKEVSIIHYKGYKISISDEGIVIDSLDKSITMQAGESQIQLNSKGINIEGGKININGAFEALYNTIPGTPIADVSQIGVSKKVTIG